MVVIKKSIVYVFLMVIFFTLGYLFLVSGFTSETRNKVEYDNDSDISYRVNYKDSGYSNNLSGNRYVANMVKSIDINYNYNKILSEYVNGFYRYNVESYLIAYTDNINDSLWERKYIISDDKTILLDKNDTNSYKIEDGFNIDFIKYREEVNKFINDYDMSVFAYLHIKVNILDILNFNRMNKEYSDNNVIVINIPITNDIFKIDVKNIDNRNSYYEFSNKEIMNILFLIIGGFCISIALTMLVMVIKYIKTIYKKEYNYRNEINRILSKYDDCIVRVDRFYVRKKYNMIYVDSFSELIDIYENKNKLICFNEVKKNNRSIFVIIEDDNAWIYRYNVNSGKII